jgi:hypothetical protein
MSGLVGSFGNVGGILFAVVWRFRGSVAGVPWWCVFLPLADAQNHRLLKLTMPPMIPSEYRISGIIALGINCLLLLVPKPKA